ncbi:MAG: hypothetical protein H6747_04150 [Deltaproteobacteria bacterium]|nr:hypothetical protein [Deltaproteobacteria bacterium]
MPSTPIRHPSLVALRDRAAHLSPAALASLAALVMLAGCGKSEPAPASAAPPTEPTAEAAAAAEPGAEKAAPPTEAPAEGPSGIRVEVGKLIAKPASAAEKLAWPDVGKAPDDFVGRVGRCELLLAPTPVAVSSHEAEVAAEQTSEKLEDRRAVFFCQNSSEGLQSTPVVVWFPEGEKGALLDLDRGSIAAVQLAGTLAGQPSAVFRGMLGGARRAAPAEGGTDLLSALIWPEKLLGQTITCRSTGLATPVRSGADDAAVRERIGGELADRRAQLRCEDARGGSVGVAAYLKRGSTGELLRIAKGTEIALKLQGFAMNQLVARFEKITANAVEIGGEAAELRRFLVDQAPLLGKPLPCRVLIAPTPTRGGHLLQTARAAIRGELAEAHTSIACAAADGSVPVLLFFAAAAEESMLTISGDTAITLTPWSVEGGRIIARFESVTKGAVAAPGAMDWRRLALDPSRAIGKKAQCEVLIPPFIGSSRNLVSEKRTLLGDGELDDAVAVCGCKDATGAVGGSRVEIYFGKGQGEAARALAAGQSVPVEVRGSVAGAVVTRWAGKAP